MNRELGRIIIKKVDYSSKEIVEALEKAGFILVLTEETLTSRNYIVAKED